MCAYVTHLRICYVCSDQDTVLISESLCALAKPRGVFGSCGLGPGHEQSETPYQCWKCKEAVLRISTASVATPPASARSHGRFRRVRTH